MDALSEDRPGILSLSLYHLVVFLCILLFVTMAPLSILSEDLLINWAAILSLLCIISSIITRISVGAPDHPLQEILEKFCLICVVVLFLVILMHCSASLTGNKYTAINAAGDTIHRIQSEMWSLSLTYILFPFLLLLQMVLFRKITLARYTKLMVSIFALSIIVVWYQRFVDFSFLNSFPLAATQAAGLCKDPNALSMCSFLLFVLLAATLFQPIGRRWRLLLGVFAMLLLWVMSVAGGRSMLGGVFILVIASPIIPAVAMHHWQFRNRLLVGFSSLALLFLVVYSLPFLADVVENFGTSGQRLSATYDKYQRNGVKSLLSEGEFRSELFQVGAALFKKAPLAGWGPGGFYREYPNEIYIEKQIQKKTPDMVLNHYLMVAVDFGLPAALLNLLLLLLPVGAALCALKKERDVSHRFTIVTMIIGNCVFLLMINMIPPANYPEVVWLWTGQLAFLTIWASRNVDIRISFSLRRKLLVVAAVISLCFLVLSGAYYTSYGHAGYHSKKNLSWWPLPPFNYNQGCYPPDSLGKGKKARWCREQSFVEIPIADLSLKEATIWIDNQYPYLDRDPVVLEYGGLNELHSQILLKRKGLHSISVPLDEEHTYQYRDRNGIEKKMLVLRLNPSRTWVPRDFGVADDRKLGVMVLLP